MESSDGPHAQRTDWSKHKALCKRQASIESEMEQRSLSAPKEALCYTALENFSDSEAFGFEMRFAMSAAFRLGDATSTVHETHVIWLHFEFDHQAKPLRRQFRLLEGGLGTHQEVAEKCYKLRSVDSAGEINRIKATLTQPALARFVGVPLRGPGGHIFVAAVVLASLKGGQGGIQSVTKPCAVQEDRPMPPAMGKNWYEFLKRRLDGPPARTYEEVLMARATEMQRGL